MSKFIPCAVTSLAFLALYSCTVSDPAIAKSPAEEAAEAVVAGCKLTLRGEMTPALLGPWMRAQHRVLELPVEQDSSPTYDKALLFAGKIENTDSDPERMAAFAICAS